MMRDISEQILMNVKYLRRYARALHGSQTAGDNYVRFCLEALLQQRDALAGGGDIKRQLFKLFHDVWRRINSGDEDIRDVDPTATVDYSIKARLEAVPPQERQVLLLTALEGFALEDVSQILDMPVGLVSELLAKAWLTVSDQISATVLIIEDEAIIAEDIAGLVAEMGHTIVGTTGDQAAAIALAKKTQPGLVLADIDLGPGGSGLTAVTEILQSLDIPVIFITAHPEQLLTGERPEPAYLITKPFDPDTLRVAVSQALSLKRIDEGEVAEKRRRGAGNS